MQYTKPAHWIFPVIDSCRNWGTSFSFIHTDSFHFTICCLLFTWLLWYSSGRSDKLITPLMGTETKKGKRSRTRENGHARKDRYRLIMGEFNRGEQRVFIFLVIHVLRLTRTRAYLLFNLCISDQVMILSLSCSALK